MGEGQGLNNVRVTKPGGLREPSPASHCNTEAEKGRGGSGTGTVAWSGV